MSGESPPVQEGFTRFGMSEVPLPRIVFATDYPQAVRVDSEVVDYVNAVRALGPGPGDVFILNDPYTGGSHLPDITLVGAIEVEGTVGGYSVVRAHHSDVGGVQAGSMPAGAREIFAEGVIVPPLRLTADVERFLLANVRTAEARRADLAAQRAAVARGAEGLRALAARYGWAAVRGAATDLADMHEPRDLTLLVGPEGGWSEREEALAITKAGHGPRNLRSETAAIAGLSVALAVRRQL